MLPPRPGGRAVPAPGAVSEDVVPGADWAPPVGAESVPPPAGAEVPGFALSPAFAVPFELAVPFEFAESLEFAESPEWEPSPEFVAPPASGPVSEFVASPECAGPEFAAPGFAGSEFVPLEFAESSACEPCVSALSESEPWEDALDPPVAPADFDSADVVPEPSPLSAVPLECPGRGVDAASPVCEFPDDASGVAVVLSAGTGFVPDAGVLEPSGFGAGFPGFDESPGVEPPPGGVP